MGFRHWLQGLLIILMFLAVVGLPCAFVGLWGSKMLNEVGNHPSKSAQIQAAGGWKILVVEAVSFMMLIALFMFLYNLQYS